MEESFGGARPPGQPAGTASIVQAGLDQARQTVFSAADVPLASTDELLAVVCGPAVKAVLEARIAPVVKHGHTPANDANVPLKILPAHARSMIIDTMDLLDGPPGRLPAHNLTVARRRLAKAAAMLLAAIDRVDVELGKGGEG